MTMIKVVDGVAFEMSEEEIAEHLASLPAEPPVLVPMRIYKAPMFRRMTDAEYEIYKQIRAGFTERLAAIFDAAEYLSPDDEYWPDLLAAAEAAYGPARAAEILAPAL